MRGPEELAQGQLEAYNDRDLDRFCSYFSPDVRVLDAQTHDVLFVGMDAFRERYARTFSNENLHCQLVNRIVHNHIVIDQELVTGMQDEPLQAVAIYHTKEGSIVEVLFY